MGCLGEQCVTVKKAHRWRLPKEHACDQVQLQTVQCQVQCGDITYYMTMPEVDHLIDILF